MRRPSPPPGPGEEVPEVRRQPAVGRRPLEQEPRARPPPLLLGGTPPSAWRYTALLLGGPPSSWRYTALLLGGTPPSSLSLAVHRLPYTHRPLLPRPPPLRARAGRLARSRPRAWGPRHGRRKAPPPARGSGAARRILILGGEDACGQRGDSPPAVRALLFFGKKSCFQKSSSPHGPPIRSAPALAQGGQRPAAGRWRGGRPQCHAGCRRRQVSATSHGHLGIAHKGGRDAALACEFAKQTRSSARSRRRPLGRALLEGLAELPCFGGPPMAARALPR